MSQFIFDEEYLQGVWAEAYMADCLDLPEEMRQDPAPLRDVWKFTDDELVADVKTDVMDEGYPSSDDVPSLMGVEHKWICDDHVMQEVIVPKVNPSMNVDLPIDGYYDAIEAVKYEKELSQQLRDIPDKYSPRYVSLEWRHKLMIAVVLGLGLLPSALCEKSTPEQYADATSTLLWAFGCLLVLYQFSAAVKTLTSGFVGCMNNLTIALIGTLNAFTAILQAINGVIPQLSTQIASAIEWWKYNAAAQTCIQGLGVLSQYIKLPFALYDFCRGSPMKFEGRTVKLQDANKYGVLASAILATLMFILVPIWGFSKSFKYWEPVLRVLEKLPYVTWLIDFIRAYCAGEADVRDIPTAVRAFAEGKEVPISGSVFDTPVSNGASHKTDTWMDAHDLKECAAREILDEDCYDDCFCTCHCREETEEAREDIAEQEGCVESQAGLGSPESRRVLKRNGVFQKSMKESLESRVERLKTMKMYQAFVPASDNEKGKEKIEVKDVDAVGEQLDDKRESKTRMCKTCEGPLTAFDLAICKPCIDKKKEEVPMQKQMFGITLEDYLVAQWDSFRHKWAPACNDAKVFIDKHKTTLGVYAFAILATAAITITVMMKSSDEKEDPVQWVPEGKKGSQGQKVRWTPAKVRQPRSHRGFEHPNSGGEEVDFELPGEEENVYKGRRAAKKMGQAPTWVSEGKIAEKTAELGMKYFPVRRDPGHVANTNRIVRRARTKRYAYYPADVQKVQHVEQNIRQDMTSESLLGKAQLTWSKVSANVFKFFQNGQFTSTAAVIGDKVHVPLHSHVDDATRRIVNTTVSAEIRGEVLPTSEDGGVFFHYGAVKPSVMQYRPPKNEGVMLVSFSSADQVEPSLSIGFASTDGLANYPSVPGDCGGLVIAVSDGAVVGTHVAGGTEVNRFEPMTEDRIKRFKANAPVLASMLFQ